MTIGVIYVFEMINIQKEESHSRLLTVIAGDFGLHRGYKTALVRNLCQHVATWQSLL